MLYSSLDRFGSPGGKGGGYLIQMLYSLLDRLVFRWEERLLSDTDAVLLVGQMGVQVGGKVVT
jgi:hypothetical protein